MEHKRLQNLLSEVIFPDKTSKSKVLLLFVASPSRSWMLIARNGRKGLRHVLAPGKRVRDWYKVGMTSYLPFHLSAQTRWQRQSQDPQIVYIRVPLPPYHCNHPIPKPYYHTRDPYIAHPLRASYATISRHIYPPAPEVSYERLYKNEHRPQQRRPKPTGYWSKRRLP